MEYVTFYDIADSPFRDAGFTIGGLTLVIVGALLYRYRSMMPKWWTTGPRIGRAFGIVYVALSLSIIAIILTKYRESSLLADARSRGQVQTVAGTITDFRPMPPGGHAMERFCVSGKCFEYSDWQYTPGFNWSNARAGPIRDGMPIRVTYWGGTIVKLEVKR